MSALKLTASASSIYARTVTATAKPKAKPKPILCTRTIHHHHYRNHNHHYQPGHTITPSAHMPPPSLGLGFTRKTLSFSPNKSGFLGCRSASPSRPGLVTHDTDTDTSRNEPVPVQSPQSPSEPSKLLTLPTILTIARVAAVPLLVATFYMDGVGGTAATTTIFIAAAVTDWLDGYIARKMNLKSSFGAFLDPVADKLMVAATLVLLCSRPLDVAVFGQVPPWLLTVPSIAIIGREITMSAVREWAASQDSKLLEAVAVNNLGKWKTATQMTALTILLATRGWSDGGAAIVVGSGVVLLYTSAGLAVWSLVVYMKKIWKVLLR